MQRPVGCNPSQGFATTLQLLRSHCVLKEGEFKCISMGHVMPCGLRLKSIARPISATQM